ncbi:MAG: HAD family hydrolase [Candidatus Coproplasma sp.]
MVKLIASDLDGTLLPPTKILPEETFSLVKKYHSLGGVFCPASGRQLPNLLKLFEEVKDYIAIIAENGGLVWYKGEIIFSDPTPTADVKRALDIIRAEEDLYPVISCTDCAYIEDDDERFFEIFNRSYTAYKKVENLDDVLDGATVIKIAVWDAQLAAEHGGKVLPSKIKGLRTIVSGRDWLDVSIEGANKGKALNALMAKLNVDRRDCVAFGDHMNDLEMLMASGIPYVTANAFPALKEKIGEEIPSNADFGVITKFKELIGVL